MDSQGDCRPELTEEIAELERLLVLAEKDPTPDGQIAASILRHLLRSRRGERPSG